MRTLLHADGADPSGQLALDTRPRRVRAARPTGRHGFEARFDLEHVAERYVELDEPAILPLDRRLDWEIGERERRLVHGFLCGNAPEAREHAASAHRERPSGHRTKLSVESLLGVVSDTNPSTTTSSSWDSLDPGRGPDLRRDASRAVKTGAGERCERCEVDHDSHRRAVAARPGEARRGSATCVRRPPTVPRRQGFRGAAATPRSRRR